MDKHFNTGAENNNIIGPEARLSVVHNNNYTIFLMLTLEKMISYSLFITAVNVCLVILYFLKGTVRIKDECLSVFKIKTCCIILFFVQLEVKGVQYSFKHYFIYLRMLLLPH